MPVLPISNGRGALIRNAVLRLKAIMRFPDSSIEDAEAIVLATEASERVPSSTPLTIPAGMLARAFAANPNTAPDGYMIAYFILATNLQCARYHPDLVGYRRAGSLLTWTSASTVKRSWKTFGPVSHLWVANGFARPKQPAEDFVLHHLAYSEAIRSLGESLYPHGQKKHGKPLLDPAMTWTAPPDLTLPKVEVEFPPPKAEELALLRRANR